MLHIGDFKGWATIEMSAAPNSQRTQTPAPTERSHNMTTTEPLERLKEMYWLSAADGLAVAIGPESSTVRSPGLLSTKSAGGLCSSGSIWLG
jgi:hypothetical protein